MRRASWMVRHSILGIQSFAQASEYFAWMKYGPVSSRTSESSIPLRR